MVLILFISNFNFVSINAREDTCKVLMDTYGANMDIRDFSGKKAINYLKSTQKHWIVEGVN